jgi:biopolymer transport protein ExbD
MAKRDLQEINAGSMADIAFLLLIFFLVTTTMESNYGVRRKLPPIQEQNNTDVEIKKKNVLEIVVNGQDMMMIEGEPKEMKDVKDITLKFLTNNGKDPNSSDNPQKAIIQIKHTRQTTYKEYISIYNELISAYTIVRNQYAKQKFGKLYDDLDKEDQKVVKNFYPQQIAESTPKR